MSFKRSRLRLDDNWIFLNCLNYVNEDVLYGIASADFSLSKMVEHIWGGGAERNTSVLLSVVLRKELPVPTAPPSESSTRWSGQHSCIWTLRPLVCCIHVFTDPSCSKKGSKTQCFSSHLHRPFPPPKRHVCSQFPEKCGLQLLLRPVEA